MQGRIRNDSAFFLHIFLVIVNYQSYLRVNISVGESVKATKKYFLCFIDCLDRGTSAARSYFPKDPRFAIPLQVAKSYSVN